MRPFEGIRVLDLTHVLAGPYCSYQLALLGADTIKIEPPGAPDGARFRGASPSLNARGLGLNYQVQGSNKRSLALDLATADGRAIFERLVVGSDVLLENYRTGVMAGWGFPAERLRELNPRLIVCSISGFGRDGDWAGRNAYDNVIQAASGLMASTGKGGTPVKTAASIVDYATGMNAAFAIASALYQRTHTGIGQVIDCAMLDGALLFMAPELAAAEYDGDDKRHMPSEAGLGTYETKDGVLMLGAFNPRQNQRLWTLLGREDFAAADDWEKMWLASPAMRDALREILATRSAADWEQALNEAGVPAQRVRSMEEALALPSLATRGLLQENAHGVTVPLAPFTFEHDGPQITALPPALGADSDAILAEFAFTQTEIDAFRRAGAIA